MDYNGEVGNLRNGVNLNSGFDSNSKEASVSCSVGGDYEDILSKRGNGCIDLNIVANCDLDEVGGSNSVMQKRDRGFDLNLEVDEESSKLGMKVQSNGFNCSHAILERSSSAGGANEELKEVHVAEVSSSRFIEESIKQNGVSGQEFHVQGTLGLKQDNMLELDEKVIDVSRSDMESPYEYGSSCRRKRKVPDSPNFGTETRLRRSNRRLSSKNDITNVVSWSVDDLSPSPAVSCITEEKMVPVEEAAILPPKLELPPSSHNLNLDEDCLLDSLSVYACLRSFSTLLFLSPFELEDFVEALNCESSNSLFDSIHVSVLHTLRKHLEQLSNESSQIAKDCLRSLNWNMLDVITYPLFVVGYLLFNGSELSSRLDLKSLNLFRNEYYKQPVTVKIEILRVLCDGMIEGEAVRSEINRRSMALESDIDRNTNLKVGRKNRPGRKRIDDRSFLNDNIIDESADRNSDECCLCKMDGNLLCCDGCPAAYHSKCIATASDLLPEGNWYCPECAYDRLKPGVKPRKALRGAEHLGNDPHGRQYYSCCGYLLVFDSSCSESSTKYYHANDLNHVLDVLMSEINLYSGIVKSIYRQWDIHVGPKKSAMKSLMSLCLDAVDKGESRPHKEIVQALPAARANSDNSPFKDSKFFESAAGIDIKCMKYEELAETDQRVEIGGCDSPSGIIKTKGSNPDGQCRTGYRNCYSFARATSLIAEDLMRKSPNQASELKSEPDLISTQLKIVTLKSEKFYWRNFQSLFLDAWKEKCGWCFPCKNLTDAAATDTDCVFNMSLGPVRGLPESEMVNIRSNNKKEHLIAIMCQIISTERRLRGLLLGPWLDTRFSKLWSENVLEASSISSLKHSLLKLEENLNRRVLSAEWLKHIDSAFAMGSAMHIVTASTRACSKNAIGKRSGSITDSPPNPSRKIESGLTLCWWRGGRLSRQLFSWKVLPRSLASKAARQSGRMKIPGILYPENIEPPKRSKYVAWRAAVESSMSSEQLGLQIRELDSNIQWDDVENTHFLPKLDKEARKSIRLFKKAVVRRKCSESGNIKYLLDFGKRRNIPDVVLENGTMIEESSSGRKRYWVNEAHVPLHLVKGFEETRIVRKTSKTGSDKGSDKGSDAATAMKGSSKERGFSYLFARAERSESTHCRCGHCYKDVLIREAVRCNFCKGFFHKQHTKKSYGKNHACHRCHGGNIPKSKTQVAKSGRGRGRPRKYFGPEKEKISKVTLSGKSRGHKNSKTSTVAKGVTLRLRNRKKDVTVLPLRRSVRKGTPQSISKPQEQKKMAKDNKKQVVKVKRGRGRPRKVKEEISLRKNRTRVEFSYWSNGLRLSRKHNDERVKQFSKDRYFVASPDLAPDHDQPKCVLCCTEESASGLCYIACEICEEWFHGDAFGLGDENIGKIIGFRCHVCRDMPSPVCPHAQSMEIDGSEVVKSISQSED